MRCQNMSALSFSVYLLLELSEGRMHDKGLICIYLRRKFYMGTCHLQIEMVTELANTETACRTGGELLA